MGHRIWFDTDVRQDHTVLYGKIRELNREIEEKFNLRLQVRTDFEEFRRLCNAIPDKCELTAIFDDKVSDIDHTNGFWIEGITEDQQIAHLQSFRYDDLEDQCLNAHWKMQRELYKPAGMSIDTTRSIFDTAPASYQINGKVCYHGELWLSKASRHRGLMPKLASFGMLNALTIFEPDWIYGFMPVKHCQRGLAAQEGYLYTHPWAPRWRISGEEASYYDEVFVWIGARELSDLWTTGERTFDVSRRANDRDDAIAPIMQSKRRDQSLEVEPIRV